MSVKTYLRPKNLDECLGYLTEFQGNARLIAGGTDLMPQLAETRVAAEALIDTGDLEGFHRQELVNGEFYIGGTVTHANLAADPIISELIPVLAAACASVGSPQIRNVGTLAGNVVNAQPAADGAMALVALGAQAEIASNRGIRLEMVEELYQGLGQSKVDPCREVLTGFRIAAPASGCGSAFGRIAPRNALCLPTVNVAVWLKSKDGKIEQARIAMGPVAEKPFRPTAAEETLKGIDLDNDEALANAALEAARASSPRDSCFRGCSDYRKQLIKVLCRRVMKGAARDSARV